MAGAALADTTLEDAEAMLTAAIDKHFENIKAEKNEKSNEN
jgi:predicted RNase H-like HicB family nuclease